MSLDPDVIGAVALAAVGIAAAATLGTCGYQNEATERAAKAACLQRTCERGAIDWANWRCACIVYEAPR